MARTVLIVASAVLLSMMLTSQLAQAEIKSSPLKDWLNLLQSHMRRINPMSHQQAAKYYAGMSQAAYMALQANRAAKTPADETAVCAYACHTYLQHWFPQWFMYNDGLISAQLANMTNRVKKPAAIIGMTAATEVFKKCIDDGFDMWTLFTLPKPTLGVYRMLPNQTFLHLPQLGTTKPMVLTPDEVNKLSTKYVQKGKKFFQSAAYYSDVEWTRQVGGQVSTVRTAYDSESPFFWNDGAGTATTPGHFINITFQVLPSTMNLFDQCKFFATLNSAVYDACIPCFKIKYEVNLWRPYHAITLGDGTGKTTVEPTWTSYMPVPNHPSYPSGHSCVSGAATQVLRTLLKSDNCNFTIGSEGMPNATARTYTTYTALSLETGKSRILGGLHYRKDCDDGSSLGKDVADAVIKRMGYN